ncbi:unnamed protein product [Paramecium pentaurelia]|uniref:Tetratricopeptide repeat protein n=1 Tax=Paramecium pentaurelia TaxID=43138 RepID=A0A8S1UU96_9CILI|nr:unnamed protein product [Paramecium pentaurelia]
MNRFPEALEQYKLAINNNRENSIYFFNKAATLNQMNRFEEALEYFDYALQRNQNDSSYQTNKGISKKQIQFFQQKFQFNKARAVMLKKKKNFKNLNNRRIMQFRITQIIQTINLLT